MTALAAPAQQAAVQTGQAGTGEGAPGVLPQPAQPEPVTPKRSPSHYLWAVLIARISYPLSAEVRKILDHIGVDCEPLHITPARGPPLWEDWMRRRARHAMACYLPVPSVFAST